MKHWQINQWVPALAAVCMIGCQQNTSKRSFFDKLDGIGGVSESISQSRQLGLLLRPLRCNPTHLVLGDSVDINIQEAYLEKGWLCGPNCESVRSLRESPGWNKQIVLKCAPSSKMGNLNIYWFMDLGDRDTGFSETGNGGLISTRLSEDLSFPLTYHIYSKDTADNKRELGVFILN